jgi:uncharacterized membrane protein YgdD (TMEM256/DUF423 family)
MRQFNAWEICRMSARFFVFAGAVSAALSVALSAAFAHLPVFAGGIPAMVQSALQLQQFHALGVMVVGLVLGWRGPSRWLLASGVLMLAGTVMFSFNIYARSVLGFDALRFAVPWGGSAWILAWLLLAAGAVSQGRSERSSAPTNSPR